MTSAFPVTTLRAALLLPAAAAEGAIAVLLPWILVEQAKGSAWLGPLAAGVVLAALSGSVAASRLDRLLGGRRMTVTAGFMAMLCLAAACAALFADRALTAYFLALGAVAADAACDIGFAARLPVLARLARRPLEAFSAANWVWSILGAAIGSVAAGWAWSNDWQPHTLVALVACMFWVWIALMALLPGSSRKQAVPRRIAPSSESRSLCARAPGRIVLVIVGVVFIAGPLDNLLIPAHLAANGRPADMFGAVIAAVCLGLALGLAIASRIDRQWNRRVITLSALLGVSLQLAVLIAVPPSGVLLAGIALGAALSAPLLPMLEATVLRAAPAAQRTRLLATLSIIVGLSDAISSAVYAWVVQQEGSTQALRLSAGLLSLAALTVIVGRGSWSGRH